jgi:UDP-N-acetyl-alpha-D-muramoyl-L-alanyl-L-glutamate epimerase
VMMKLLEHIGQPFDVFAYSSSIYGTAAPQHALLDRLIARGRPGRVFKQWIFDDFIDSPVLELHPELGLRSVTAAETPSSVFAGLLPALAFGHTNIALGHERSADSGQLHWERTDEQINHQWGKSSAAERLLSEYIENNLIVDFKYWSPLKPIHDVVIFSLLRRSPGDVPLTHSCNVEKPWCLRCAKCLYVWLGYAAFLDRASLLETFGADDLLARPVLAPIFHALIADGVPQPFECIGSKEEARLFLAACQRRGYPGAAARLAESGIHDPGALLERSADFLTVDVNARIPPAIAQRLFPALEVAAEEAGTYLRALWESSSGDIRGA